MRYLINITKKSNKGIYCSFYYKRENKTTPDLYDGYFYKTQKSAEKKATQIINSKNKNIVSVEVIGLEMLGAKKVRS